jgi:NDP-sugar pyrophosphorylase family protein
VSLEREVFPASSATGSIGFEFEGEFTDIGTPEDYRLATASPGRFAPRPD